MPTYLDIQNRVADILNRTTYTSQIQIGIIATIRAYEKERFWFNETVTALTTTATIERLAVPSDHLITDRLEIVNESADLPMINVPFSEIRYININESLGLPLRYCQYGVNWWLANVPDSAYTVLCYYLQKLPELVNPTDTNDWLSAAEDVICFGAAKFVAKTYIKDLQQGAVFSAMQVMYAENQLYQLRDQKFQVRLRATRF